MFSRNSAEEMGVVVRWFRDSLGLSEEGTRTMLVRKPGLLCKGLKEKLKPKVGGTLNHVTALKFCVELARY